MGVRVPSYAHGAVCLIRQGRLDEPVRPRVYQSHRHLSQMHTTNYTMPFIREKAAYIKKIPSHRGRGAPPPTAPI